MATRARVVEMDGRNELPPDVKRSLLNEDPQGVLNFLAHAIRTRAFSGILTGDEEFIAAAGATQVSGELDPLLHKVKAALSSSKDRNALRNTARALFIEYIRSKLPGIIPMKSYRLFWKTPACGLDFKRHVTNGTFDFLIARDGEKEPFFRWNITGLAA